MKQRDDNYHIQIKPALLFNLNRIFKSAYTPWVFAYLKLDYNNYIHNAPNRWYKIDRRQICDFFKVHPSTITRAFSELIENGLMVKQNQEYKLLNDKYNNTFPVTEGLPEFIQINNNFFIDMVQRLNEVCGDNDSKDRSLVKVLNVFYFLISKNRNVIVDTPILVSDETAKSISKALHHDENYVKDYLKLLESIGNIEMHEGTIKTVYTCGTCQHYKKNSFEKKVSYPITKNHNTEEAELVPIKGADTTVTEAVISKKPVPEAVTDNERIRHILIMSGGNAERTKSLLEKYNISVESLSKFLETY